MKAKEYIEKFYKEDSIVNSLFDIIYNLFTEVGIIAEHRNAQFNDALISIFKEQNKKWQAILNKLELIEYKEGIFKKAFLKYCHSKVPELKGRI